MYREALPAVRRHRSNLIALNLRPKLFALAERSAIYRGSAYISFQTHTDKVRFSAFLPNSLRLAPPWNAALAQQPIAVCFLVD